MTRIGIVAGESSGDLLGAGLIDAIRKRVPHAQFEGIAGPRMVERGCEALFPAEKLSILGLVDALIHYRELHAIRAQLLARFDDRPPDLFIGIDAPDFNLTVEAHLKKRGVKTVQYVSPQIWAWRQYRVRKIARSVDLMLTLFPFEAAFYQRHAVPVTYVGHPLADHIPLQTDRAAARAALGLPEQDPVVAVLPGSRVSEVRYLAETFIETMCWCHRRRPAIHYVVPLASARVREMFAQRLQSRGQELPLTLLDGRAREAMAASDVILLASGTATLEALLVNRPMVVAYRIAWLNYVILKRMIDVPNYSLPNLLAGERIVPEFVQRSARPDALGAALFQYLDNPAQAQRLERRFAEIHRQLRQNTDDKAAQAILRLLDHAA